MSNGFLDFALSIQKIKKIEMVMPIIRKMGMITPLLIGDDLALKSTLSSPQSYDREICATLYKHLIEISDGENVYKPADLTTFMSQISNIDKICLLFGIHQITYETFGKRSVKCENKNCGSEFFVEFHSEELLHDDTFTPWDEEQPFTEFIYEFTLNDGDYNYIFGTRLPTMKDHNSVLNFINSADIDEHINKIGNLFALPEQMALLTKYIKLGHKDQDISEYKETHNLQEILITFTSVVPKSIQSDFFNNYNNKFSQYQPKFYKSVVCPNCDTVQERRVNIELEFFRRTVLEETGEE